MASEAGLDRRGFLKGAAAGGASASALGTTNQAAAQGTPPPAAAPPPQPAATSSGGGEGYMFLKPDEAAFVEALVDTMIPADDLSPAGTEIGVNTYIDRACASGWGKGDRLYMQGPWKAGTANQGYQLALTPAQLWRAGIEAVNAHCHKAHGKAFDGITGAQRNAVLTALDAGRLEFEGGLSARAFWAMAYQNVMEGMFADPIYGGNRDKAGWKLVGFPGVVQNNRARVVSMRNRKVEIDPVSIADMS